MHSKLLCQLMAKCLCINTLHVSSKTGNLHLSPRSSDFTHGVLLKQERKKSFHLSMMFSTKCTLQVFTKSLFLFI